VNRREFIKRAYQLGGLAALISLGIKPETLNGAVLQGIIGSASPSGGASYPDIIFYWGCETTTAEKSAGDNLATLNGDSVLSTAQHPVGLKSLSIPTTYDYAIFDVSGGDIADHISGRIGAYVYWTTLPTNQDTIFHISYNDANRIVLWLWFDNVDYHLYPRYYSGGSATSYETRGTTTIAINTLYFIEVAWDLVGVSPNINPNLKLYVNGGLDASDTTVVATWAGTPTKFELGSYSSDGGGILFIDQVLSSNDPTRDLYAIRDLTSFPD
jgi:hypothetical protein